MKLLTYLLSYILFSTIANAQNWGANTFSQFTNEAVDVEVDAAGNSYITGYLTGETAFNTANVVQSALGNGDIYVAKYSPSGNLIWKETFGGNFSDRAVDLAIGPDQNIVVTGQFFGTVAFGTTTVSSTSNSKDIFLLKLDPSGQVIWAKKEGGNMSENAYGVTVDSQNNILLTGQYQGSTSIAGVPFTSALDPVTNLSSFDFFISKYSSNGSDLWAKSGFAEYEDRGLAVAVDDADNVFFTGQFSDTLSFAGNTYNNNGFNVGFVSKLSPTGQLIYFNQLKAGMVLPYDLEVDMNQNVVITGDFLGNLNYYDATGFHSIQNPYSKQIFVIKTGNNGNYSWNYTLGSNNDLSARAISMDAHKDIYVTGYFKCDLSQIQDTNHLLFNSIGFKDPYLLKLNELGQHVYIKQIGGKMDDEGLGVALPQMDLPIVCGSYTKDLNLTVHSTFPTYTYANNNYQLHYYMGNETAHNYLIGDSTRNSFLIQHLNTASDDYNYFEYGLTDSIPGSIVGNTLINDTVHFCNLTNLTYNTNSYNHYGPSYFFNWNTNQTSNPITISSTNDYAVSVIRNDGCASDMDSIHAISEPIPPLPLLTDTIGVNTLQPGPFYHDYHFCYPDSVEIVYSSLPPGNTLNTHLVSYTFNENGEGPFTLNQAGTYVVTTTNQYCHSSGHFDFFFDHVIQYDSIQLDIVMQNLNDSITICSGHEVDFAGIDLFTNPNGLFSALTEPYANVHWTINGSTTSNYPHVYTDFTPQTSGWYTVTLEIDLGYDNLCGIDTTNYFVSKQFYIEVLPLPTWSSSISGDNLLCPNGSVFLVASNPNPQLHWNGPGIIWQNYNDSIEVNAPGIYFYHGTITGSNGCSSTFSTSYYITLKTAPNIQSLPSDGIICPYDSVYMEIPVTFLDYQWIGPNGDSLSTTNSCYGQDQGFYYVHITDNEGCHLTTPPYELKEYTTPTISVFPDVFLCEGETVDLIVTYSGEPTFQWSPINSTNDEITVNQPGVYIVSISQCGFTVQDSVEIIDGTFTATISAMDTALCFNELATIIATPSNATYEWNNGQITGASYVVDEAGSYYAIATNEYACTDTTNTIVITTIAGSFPPSIADVTICPGLNVNLVDTTNFTLNWYDTDTNLLAVNNLMHLMNVTNDTNFLVAYTVAQCAPVYSLVTVSVHDSLGNYTIYGDSLLCPNENTQFFVNTTNETISWTIGGVNFPSVNPINVTSNQLIGDDLITVTISNQCFATSISDSIYHILPEPIQLAEDTLVLCAYDEATIQLLGNVDSVIWNGSFGQISDDELVIDASVGTGSIFVSAIDVNGCLTDTLELHTIASNLNYQLTADVGLSCLGDTGSISIVGVGIDSLVWTTPFGNFDTTTLDIPFTSSNEGLYGVQLWDTLGCIYSDSINLAFNELPVFDLGTDTILCINDIYTYYFPSDTNTYVWTTYGGTTTIPILFNQDLILTATAPSGCVYQDTLVVMSVDCNNVLPNVITPNGDGNNDIFFIDDALALQNDRLIIYNRWGNILLDVVNYQNDFDGKDLSEGTYFYIFFKDRDDESKGKVQGFLQLIR